MTVTADLVDEKPPTGSSTADEDTVPAAGDGSRAWTWVLWSAFALVVLPLVVSAFHLLLFHRSYKPNGDLALTEMLTRDVGTRWLELGPISRDGWYHPGPLMFYVLAAPYRLLGSTSVGLEVAALLVNIGAIAGITVLARRRGGPVVALLVLVGTAFLMRSMGPDQTRLAWNPYITVLPFALLIFLTWALTGGSRFRWVLPAAVFVASFCAESHIGYVPLALPLLAIGAVWLVVATPRGERRRLVAPEAAGVGVFVLVWLPVLTQYLTNHPNNVDNIRNWFHSGGPRHERVHALADGWHLVNSAYGARPEWLLGTRPLEFTAEPRALYAPVFPGLLVLVAAACAFLWWRKVAGARELIAVWFASSVIGVVATGRTVGPIFAYRMGWSWVLGMLSGVFIAWAGWRLLTGWRPPLERRVLVPLCLVLVAVLAVVSSVAHVQAGSPDATSSRRLRQFVPAVEAALRDRPGAIIVDGTTFDGAAYAVGLAFGLERDGYDARMLNSADFAGKDRAYRRGPVREHVIVTSDMGVAYGVDNPGLRLVSYSGRVPLHELLARAPNNTKRDQAIARRDLPTYQRLLAANRFVEPGSGVGIFVERKPGRD